MLPKLYQLPWYDYTLDPDKMQPRANVANSLFVTEFPSKNHSFISQSFKKFPVDASPIFGSILITLHFKALLTPKKFAGRGSRSTLRPTPGLSSSLPSGIALATC